jgi:XTP/dITP diphosphohydrolase
MKLIFATNNPHKQEEAQEILGPSFQVVTPASLGFPGDLPETHDTLRDNSIQKACAVWNLFQTDCFADDTGLEVDALGGAPGVYSARYAGEGKDPAANRRRLLEELEGIPFAQRTARFRCVVTLVQGGALHVFEGTCEGHIALQESAGVQGFGYDSIFVPEGLDVTIAEISIEEKNVLSHRGKAMRLLQCHLQENPGSSSSI